ncbi:MAG: methyltransferase domain-containing protein [Sulfuricaulis sp.]
MIVPVKYQRSLHNAFAFLKKFGARRFLQELHFRFINNYHDWRLGIQTGGMIRLEDIGINRVESVEYTPTGYFAIYRALKIVPIPAASISFLDFGSGKGRVIAIAATFPYKKVFGVDISADLNRLAQSNIDVMRHRRAKHVEIIQSDAVKFIVPDDVNVIFLFNPFYGKTLAKVIDNILASYTARPRPIYVLFFNKIHFEQLIKDAKYECIIPVRQMHFYPNYSFGIYVIDKKRDIPENGLCPK